MYRNDLTAAHEIIKSQQQEILSLKRIHSIEDLKDYFSSLVKFKRNTIIVLLMVASLLQIFVSFNIIEATKAAFPEPKVSYIIVGPIEITPMEENVVEMEEEVIYVKSLDFLRKTDVGREPAIWSAD